MSKSQAIIYIDLPPEMVGKPSDYNHYHAILLPRVNGKYSLVSQDIRPGQSSLDAAIEAASVQCGVDTDKYDMRPCTVAGSDAWILMAMGELRLPKGADGFGLFNGGYWIPQRLFGDPQTPKDLAQLYRTGKLPNFVDGTRMDYLIRYDPKFITGSKRRPVSWMAQVRRC